MLPAARFDHRYSIILLNLNALQQYVEPTHPAAWLLKGCLSGFFIVI